MLEETKKLEILMRYVRFVFGKNFNQFKNSRNRFDSLARQCFVAIAKDDLGISYVKIGKFLSKHHTSIMYCHKRANDILSINFRLKNDYSLFKENHKEIRKMILNDVIFTESGEKFYFRKNLSPETLISLSQNP